VAPRKENKPIFIDQASDVMRLPQKINLRLFEIARVLVRLDYIARVVVNANHAIM
jgi:hypothetical protein